MFRRKEFGLDSMFRRREFGLESLFHRKESLMESLFHHKESSMKSLFHPKESLLLRKESLMESVLPHKEDRMSALFRQNPRKSNQMSRWTHAYIVQQIFLISDRHVFPPGRVSDRGSSWLTGHRVLMLVKSLLSRLR